METTKLRNQAMGSILLGRSNVFHATRRSNQMKRCVISPLVAMYRKRDKSTHAGPVFNSLKFGAREKPEETAVCRYLQ